MNRITMVWDKLVNKYNDAVRKLSGQLDAMPESKLILILVVLSLLLLLITSQFIEKSSDAVYKWGILRYYVEFGKWYPSHVDHHQGRWGINIPVIGLMKIFGSSPLVYYVFPAIAGLVGSILTFIVTAKLSTRLAGLAAFLIFAIFPLTTRENTQFLPMLPAAMFILAAFYFVLKWLEKKLIINMILAGLMVIMAYGCKITSLYWAPAFALFIALYGSDRKCYFKFFRLKIGPAVIIFALTILAGLLIETLTINHLCNLSYGRLQVITGSHLHNRVNPEFCNFFVWLFSFLRPLSLSGKYFESIPCFFIFLLGVVSACICFFKGNINKKFIAFSLLAVYLMHCYIVYKIFPFLHPEKAHSRYFMIVAVACIIMYCASQAEWDKFIWSRIKNVHLVQILKLGLCMAWLVTSLIYVANSWLRNGTILNVISAERKLAEAQSNRVPVLLKLKNNPENDKLRSFDRKYSLMWMSVFGPGKLIPQLDRQPFAIVTDASGRKYIPLFNQDKLKDQTEQEILVLKEYKISGRKASFKKIRNISLNE